MRILFPRLSWTIGLAIAVLIPFQLFSHRVLAGSALVHNNQVIVKFKEGKSPKSVQSQVNKRVAHVRSLRLSYDTYEILKVPDDVDPFVFSVELKKTGIVEFAYPNIKKRVSGLDDLLAGNPYLPNDPYLLGEGNTTLEQAFENPRVNQWGLLYTNAPLAWGFTTGDPSVIVAVVDTGIKFLHPELQGRLWENPGEIPDDGIDNDANGFTDDVYGYDFANWDPSRGETGDPDVTDPQTNEPHGSWVAGIIASATDDSTGIAGVAGGGNGHQGVRLMILRVGTNLDIPVSAEVEALDYAVTHGAKIINMSFGGEPGGTPEENAIRDAWSRGAVLVAAGGNVGFGNIGGALDWPAALPEVVCVGATTIFNLNTVRPSTGVIDETVATYSKTGEEMDVVAPGTHILTTNGASGYTFHPDYQFTGTSASTPMVAGFAALIASYYSTFTNAQIRQKLESSVVDMGIAGWDQVYGHGRIDMAKAFPTEPPPPPPKAGDYNRDGKVNEADVLKIIDHFGHRSSYSGGAPTDSEDDIIDGNQDGIIDELDIFVIGRNYTG